MCLLFDFIKIKSTDLITNYNLSAFSLVNFINLKKNISIFFLYETQLWPQKTAQS